MLTSTTLIWLLAISAFQVLAGIVFGWWLHGSKKGDTNHEILGRRLTDALGRLQSLAGDMCNHTSQHAEQVVAVEQQLTAAAQGDIEQLHNALLSGMSNIMESNKRLQTQLNDVEVKLEEQARQIESQLVEARIDSLTGIANRRAFDEELLRRLAEWRRRHTPTSLMLIDIDHFKQVNDTQGHPTGDAVLRETARVLSKTMREMDFTARFGGEEFAVILPNTTLSDARRAAQRALKAVAAHPFEHEGREVPLTISIGLSGVMPSDDSASLIRRADEALYLSKAAGRNCGHFHDGANFLILESPRISDEPRACDAPAPVAEKSASTAAAAASETPPPPADAKKPAAQPTQPHIVDAEEDPLTGLPGAPPFSSELRRRVQRARSEDRPLTLLLVDVDHLGELNRTAGAAAGDRVLRKLAEILRSTARECDFAARYHDGQFALALYSVGANEATRTAERIRRALTAAAYAGDKIPQATVCCGIAEAGPGDRSVSLLMRASTALAAAKSAGRDCVFIHDGRNVEPADEAAIS